MAVDIILPRTPSINRLWRIGRGRMFRSAEYESWLQACTLLIRQQRIPKVSGKYELLIRVTRPDKRRRDVDNPIKALNDLLQRAGVVEDDCLCEKVTCEWVPSGPPTCVTVTPLEE